MPIGRRLPASLFYSAIVAGIVLGIAVCSAAGWSYLEFGEHKPTGRRVWDGLASEFVIPVCVIVGATFGGIAGVAVAVLTDRFLRSSPSA